MDADSEMFFGTPGFTWRIGVGYEAADIRDSLGQFSGVGLAGRAGRVIDGGGHAAARAAAILAADGRGWTPIAKCFWGTPSFTWRNWGRAPGV